MSVVASSNGGPRKRDGRLRVIVLGYIVRGPLGGLAWHPLQYVLGLARLGKLAETYTLRRRDTLKLKFVMNDTACRNLRRSDAPPVSARL